MSHFYAALMKKILRPSLLRCWLIQFSPISPPAQYNYISHEPFWPFVTSPFRQLPLPWPLLRPERTRYLSWYFLPPRVFSPSRSGHRDSYPSSRGFTRPHSVFGVTCWRTKSSLLSLSRPLLLVTKFRSPASNFVMLDFWRRGLKISKKPGSSVTPTLRISFWHLP